MAINNGVYLEDTWANLRQNPVFRRTMLPRGFRIAWRSPIARAVLLSLVAIGLYQAVMHLLSIHLFFIMMSAVILWTMIHSIQHYLCWGELTTMAATGNLEDYLNSGLSPADVTMGVIYPACISETISSILILAWFLFTMDTHYHYLQTLLVVVIIMKVMELVRAPMLFLPDVENYLHQRNPVALYFIGFSIFVPILCWFAIVYAASWIYTTGCILTGTRIDAQTPVLFSFLIAFILVRWPVRWFGQWRLNRFYKRHSGLDELIERYLEQKPERG
jgi:hypothetical protein